MEPQRNVELPNAQGGFSNERFESYSFEQNQNQETQQSAQNYNVEKSREAVFSAFDQFSPQGENLQSQPQSQVLPPIQNQAAAQNPINSPAKAMDVELMEDEWVKDLKKMILETKNDPFAREVRFKEMQVDYLKKRYNRIINGGK